ncbi:PHP domain protein [Lyngbya aestuarii BL J]|uniref:PHP domain protein n=1 Tax=Lyngbya aestuarii BL J TaxID=1348334 RepID=U7QF15_9CYAN|nr:PHP domain-containing protein [Lyngbya aestuarii]ERT06534.1 PHP domain protein [Lyngbya aestuarii BL J]
MFANLAPASASLDRISHPRGNADEQLSSDAMAQNLTALQRVFQTIDINSCPSSYNFHMHTVKSDGQLKPNQLIEQAIAIGLKGLAITDHHTTQGYTEAQRCLEAWKASHPENSSTAPTLWTGLEINAGLLNVEVHILAYAFNPQAICLQPYLQGHTLKGSHYRAENVIAAIHQAGGLAVLAHPARYRSPAKALIPEAARFGVDGVEVYYSYRNTNPWKPTPKITEEVKQLANRYGLLHTCGTDSHGCNLLLRL